MSSSLRSAATPFTMPLQAFIPFILPEYTADQVVREFDQLGLGRVTYIDMHTKESTRSSKISSYSYAFIKVEPYDTTAGRNLRDKLQNRLVVRIMHDSSTSNYWDIKPFLSVEQRMAGDYVISPSTVSKTSSTSTSMRNEPYDECVDVSVFDDEDENGSEDDADDVDTVAAVHSPRWAAMDIEEGQVLEDDEDGEIINHLCEGLMITPLEQIQIQVEPRRQPMTEPGPIGSSVSFFDTIWTNPTPMPSITNQAFRDELQREYEQLQREIEAMRTAPDYNMWGGFRVNPAIQM